MTTLMVQYILSLEQDEMRGEVDAEDKSRKTGTPRKFETCVVSGCPPGLDTPVYTKDDMSKICDALVEPLATAIHSLDDIDALLACSDTAASAEFSLGSLLRDVCAKVVPLTTVLEAKQQAAERFRRKHGAQTQQRSKEEESSSTVESNDFATPVSETQDTQSGATGILSERFRLKGINKRGMSQPKRKKR